MALEGLAGGHGAAASIQSPALGALRAPDDAIMKIRAHATRVYADRPFDLILFGHVHVRDDFRIDGGEQSFRTVNLGSWMDAPCYFKLDGSEERFYEWANE